ncbi:Indian hedgehog B protein [Gracilariopsis chorda]|uniref:Indian hedgehog B protein n=1 Tax=Gracilariopsis chorda TaxID=448386 RepID=A0A2V3IRZ6_9FLOR|nr:Indian hedgehog B protein [Gracilariopsis chorda]|eukprot:PXF44872.1 Indian hedgehog B protein [Gracilariopsis chorda]
MHLSAFVVALATCLAAASAASLPFLARQTTPEDAIGRFKRSVFRGGQCFQFVAHNATVDDDLKIAHSVMSIDDIACTGEGAMQVYLDPTEALAQVDSQVSKNLINTISSSVTDALYGVESVARTCGNRRFPPKTLVIIFTPETRVQIGIDSYFATKRYMFIDDPSKDGICQYTAERRPVAAPVSPSPAPSVSASVSPAPTVEATVPSPSPTEEGGAVAPVPVPVPGGEVTPTPTSTPTSAPIFPTEPTVTDTEEPTFTPGDDDDDDDDDPICFPAEATVEMEDGSTKRMDQVQIGDRVKVGYDMFSEVFMFTHKVSKRVSQFVKLDMASGASISATSGHYVYLNGRLAAARTAKVGDVMELGNGARSTVEKVSMVRKSGLYNPQTLHGDIIVNEVRASTFTTAIEAGTAQAMLAPLRMVYDVFGWSTSAFDGGFDMINKLVTKGELVL